VSRFAWSVARVPVVLAVLWLVFAAVLPLATERYPAFTLSRGAGAGCVIRPGGFQLGVDPCVKSIEDVYGRPLPDVVTDAAARSVALLAGVSFFAFTAGMLLGIAAALLRYRSLASGAILGSTGVVAAIPSFFLAYFLQIAIIFVGGLTGHTVLPVFGFGFDGHLVLPLLTLGLPAVAIAAQIAAARTADVLDADFVTTARAKGLPTSWIVRVHVLPHVVPVLLEAVGSGVRVAVASLPIIELILGWNGIGYLALQSVAVRDPVALTASLLTLAAFFSLTSLLLDLRRTRFH
jgi:ABC-type dipeptide/oligopeptide/nickel transport system permease component